MILDAASPSFAQGLGSASLLSAQGSFVALSEAALKLLVETSSVVGEVDLFLEDVAVKPADKKPVGILVAFGPKEIAGPWAKSDWGTPSPWPRGTWDVSWVPSEAWRLFGLITCERARAASGPPD